LLHQDEDQASAVEKHIVAAVCCVIVGGEMKSCDDTFSAPAESDMEVNQRRKRHIHLADGTMHFQMFQDFIAIEGTGGMVWPICIVVSDMLAHGQLCDVR
jgi:hypothetical protein